MPQQITVAVDAMGGDGAPAVEVEGSLLAAEEFGAKIILVGREDVLSNELSKYFPARGQIEIVHAKDVVTMHDNPSKALRSKKDSSIRAAAEQVLAGRASGLVSAGNTGR